MDLSPLKQQQEQKNRCRQKWFMSICYEYCILADQGDCISYQADQADCISDQADQADYISDQADQADYVSL